MLQSAVLPTILTLASLGLAAINNYVHPGAPYYRAVAVAGLVLIAYPFLAGISATLRWQKHLKSVHKLPFGVYIAWTLFTYIAVSIVFALAYLHSAMLGCSIQGPNNTTLYSPDAFWTSSYNALYFSVITGASLGYGDFLPVGLFPRLLSMLNIVLGPIMLISAFTLAVSSKPDLLD